MGNTVNIMNKVGLPNLNYSDQIYDKYFKETDTSTLAAFHEAYVEFCIYLNSIMPGKHFDLPPRGVIKQFFEGEWTKEKDDEGKKKKLLAFMRNNVTENKSGRGMIAVGLAVPPAAIFLKKTVEDIPQVKKFRLHLIPNFVLVPSFTLASVIGMRLIQNYKKSKATINNAAPE